jgi:hypothetical protein
MMWVLDNQVNQNEKGNFIFLCVRACVCVCCDKNKNKNEAGEESGGVGKKKGATAMADEGEEIVASTKAKVRMELWDCAAEDDYKTGVHENQVPNSDPLLSGPGF